MRLVIGNKNYSSWSMRAWTFLRESDLDFEEMRIPMFTPGWAECISQYTPAGRVPVLVDGGVNIWDSLAIVLHLQRHYPSAVGWPADPLGLSLVAEMHSGFMALRDELPFNVRSRQATPDLGMVARAQVERIQHILVDCLERSGGPFLFGHLSVTDLFYAPMVLRFQTYGIPIRAERFAQAVLNLRSVVRWCQEAEVEAERLDFLDNRILASRSPLTFG